ncbi:MAG: hypothetical protein ABIK28_21805 [Planctomycetota bacterium]
MLPKLTHKQFLILDLMGSEMAGKGLREKLRKEGEKMSLPAFYQLMSRMEDAKWVKGWYVQKEIDGQIVRERRYKPLGLGERIRMSTLEFYRQRDVQRAGDHGLQPGRV